jgi:hypothetical protein
MVDVAPQAVTQTEAAAKPAPARYYVLALLTIVYALNFLDRTIFNVLIEPIKKAPPRCGSRPSLRACII